MATMDPLTGPAWAGVALVAVATVAGESLERRAAARPVAGGAALGAGQLPDSARVLVTSALAGELLRAALGAYRMAAPRAGARRAGRPLATAALTATVHAGALVVLAR